MELIEIIRWFSLGLSVVALGFSCYSAWFAFYVNKKLSRRNMDLFVEKVGLWKQIEVYEAEISRLRNLLESRGVSDEGNNDDNG